MSTLTEPILESPPDEIPFENGDRMTREEFHEAYLRTPEGFKAELIGGIVYVASPLRRRHGTAHLPLSTVLFTYEMSTPGVEGGDNATLELGDDAELQPDLYLRVLSEFGGQTDTKGTEYIRGAPEFVLEIALSSKSIDLHRKREDYQRYGVKEYLVYCVREKQLRWFDLANDKELSADAQGVIRLQTFPGLWLDSDALIKRDGPKLMSTLNLGLASPEHAAFVAELARRREAHKPS